MPRSNLSRKNSGKQAVWRHLPLPAKERLLRTLRRDRYWSDPAAWVRDSIDFPEGEHPASYQLGFLDDIASAGDAALRGPHGLGKSSVCAWLVWWFFDTRDGWANWRNPITASVWRQLNDMLFPEIHLWGSRLRWDRMGREQPRRGRELLDRELKGATGTAFALASNDPTAMEGIHADQLLFIYDESKSIPDETFDATEGAFSSADPSRGREAYRAVFSTPGPPAGRFYDMHARRPGYEHMAVRHVSITEAIAEGRVTEAWRARMTRTWGEGSPNYVMRVQGDFATDTDSIIPLGWLEAAHERWLFLQRRALDEGTIALGDFRCAALDVADEGGDRIMLALRHKTGISEVRVVLGDSMAASGALVGALRGRKGGYGVVDADGLGAPVLKIVREALGEQKINRKVYAFHGSAASKRTDASGELKFLNRRAEAWWGLREALAPDSGLDLTIPADVDMPDGEGMVTADLTTPRWTTTSRGLIKVEDKDEIRKRLGRSPDAGDAVVMALWPPYDLTPAKTSSAAGRMLPGGR